jgi:hypothetical protein
MIDRMGREWCFTFLALVCIAAMPTLWVELKWGPLWREERMVRMDKENDEKRRAEEADILNATMVEETEAGTGVT